MNGWNRFEDNLWYHDDKGMVLGTVKKYYGQHKALIGNMFIGWYINEDFAKKAVEEAYMKTKNEDRLC